MQPSKYNTVNETGPKPQTRQPTAMKFPIKLIFGIALLSATQMAAQTSTGSLEEPLARELNVFVPNAFTPNGDGHNDVFRPTISGPELDVYELTIRDRAGNEVFSSVDPTEVWDGSVQGGGYVSTPTVYVYFLKVKSVEDMGIKMYKGHITLIR